MPLQRFAQPGYMGELQAETHSVEACLYHQVGWRQVDGGREADRARFARHLGPCERAIAVH
ncbi:hypothetical protein CQB05_01095 [Paracidovorax citrulli]|nr:hypothetical protein CQB05_01095 [Paracidovorax citrulli]